jgi:acid stress-induced BolA-like protein IbaG/YrbA
MCDEVRKVLPDAQIEVVDLTGSMDHFHVRVVCESFVGMRPLQRQKIILNHFKPHIPQAVHAIDLKCMTPEQAEKTGDTVFHPHGGGTGIHIKSLKKQGHIE